MRFSIAFILFFFSLSSFAKQEEVHFGAYINDIYSLDMRTGTAEVDVDLWTLSNSPIDWIERIEIKNGLIEERSAEVKKRIGDKYYITERLKIKLTKYSWMGYRAAGNI